MKQFTYTITDPVGIHARPAGLLVKEAKKYADSAITLSVEATGKSANALKLMALMSMGVKGGDTVTVTVEGGDEEAAAAGMQAFLSANL